MTSGRVDSVQYAERVNAAAQLVESGMPVGEAVAVLAARFGVSPRQARRYVERAGPAGERLPIPEPSMVFTIKLPAALATWVRTHARQSQTTISAVVTRALTEFFTRRPARRGR